MLERLVCQVFCMSVKNFRDSFLLFFKVIFIIRRYFSNFFRFYAFLRIKILCNAGVYNIIGTVSFCRVMGCLPYTSGLQLGLLPDK
jgi:hypothetical protein